MSTHEQIKELLAGFALAELSEQQSSEVKTHLDDCQQCRSELKRLEAVLECAASMGELSADEQVCESAKQALLSAVADEQKKQPTPRSNIRLEFIWRTIMENRTMKLAAAAVIIIAVLAGLPFLGGNGTSVVWAEVIENIESAPILSYRLKTSITGLDKEGTTEVESVVYNSTEYGIRVDTYTDGKVTSTTYMNPAEKVLVTVIHEAKKYLHMPLTDQHLSEYHQKNDPREIVKKFMSFGYTELGRDNINGIEVEGIEINNPAFAEGTFENLVVRLWADVETKTPVLLEMETLAAEGDVQMQIVMEQFELVPEIEPNYFELNIPSDYTSMAGMERADGKSNEERAIQGLRAFAEISNGKYPSSLALATAMTEAGKALKESGRDPNNEEEVNRMMSNMMSIPATCAFYAELIKENKDVAYYGDVLMAEDADAVLMRWKISDNEYRVIFGDLSTLDVSAEKLAELEKPVLEQ